MSRLLIVTPYAPSRDGIAAYAVQQVAALRAEGHQVTVLSPGPSAAHEHLALLGRRGALSLAKHIRAGRYDRVIVQFHPDLFYPIGASTLDRAQISAGLAAAFAAAKRIEVYVHEIDYRHGEGARGLPMRLMWRQVDVIHVHTVAERAEFISAFGLDPTKVVLTEHGKDFQQRTLLSRTEARASLGIAENETLFLSIGFIQEHKGFDRGVRAFAGLADRGAFRYAIVGSVRVDEPAFVAYLRRLQALVDSTPGAELHGDFVTDELFDRWIVASDALILPYRAIWSSGVLERARLYGRTVIATAVGGLAEQASGLPGVRLVDNDFQLRKAVWDVAGVEPGTADSANWTQPWADQMAAAPIDLAVLQEQLEVRASALRAAGIRHVNDEPGTVAMRRRTPTAAVDSGGLEDVRAVAGIDADGRRPSRLGGTGEGPVSARLRSLPAAGLPTPASRLPGGALVKRVIAKLTRWQLQPLADQVNSLRSATADAVDDLDDRP